MSTCRIEGEVTSQGHEQIIWLPIQYLPPIFVNWENVNVLGQKFSSINIY